MVGAQGKGSWIAWSGGKTGYGWGQKTGRANGIRHCPTAAILPGSLSTREISCPCKGSFPLSRRFVSQVSTPIKYPTFCKKFYFTTKLHTTFNPINVFLNYHFISAFTFIFIYFTKMSNFKFENIFKISKKRFILEFFFCRRQKKMC